MPMRATPFFMFQGSNAEGWLDLVIEVVPEAHVRSILRNGADGPGIERSVAMAEVEIGGLLVRCNDSPPVHDFTFTPSVSLFLDIDSDTQHSAIHDQLARDGVVLMPPDDYGFSRRFSWVQDRFGVSWQLNV